MRLLRDTRAGQAAGPTAAVSLVIAVAFGAALIPVILGVIAMSAAIIARRAEVTAGGAGRSPATVAALVLGLAGVAIGVVNATDGDDRAQPQSALAAEDGRIAAREAYCRSDAGEALANAAAATPDDPGDLRQTTDRVLQRADEAPRGAGCAVSALDALVITWRARQTQKGYRTARGQIKRIRAYQSRHGLARSEY